jgi:hypothetical protein
VKRGRIARVYRSDNASSGAAAERPTGAGARGAVVLGLWRCIAIHLLCEAGRETGIFPVKQVELAPVTGRIIITTMTQTGSGTQTSTLLDNWLANHARAP